MSSSDYRYEARQKLAGKWGRMALMTFLVALTTNIITKMCTAIFGGSDNQQLFVTNILEIVLLFAFSYGLLYAALYVVRGGTPGGEQVVAVFTKKHYLPLFLVNLLKAIINYLLNFLIYLPLLLGGIGFAGYIDYIFGTSYSTFEKSMTGFSLGLLFLLIILCALLEVLVSMIVSGVFYFAVLTRFDFPELGISEILQYAWFLIKDRLKAYIFLQLSFVGWFILGIFSLGIGLFWVMPYMNCSLAVFYDVARQEKGDPKIIVKK